ncbi:MAG: CHASE3 domain-containing protein [Bacteroidetes bacterium]|nr:CHASE3 domain-containing protein [Bacteroidota bacterium]
MKFNLSRRIRSGYLAAFILLLFSYILSINTTLRLRTEHGWVNHSREVMNKLELLISYIKDSEIGLRGLIMMKDEKYLLPYYTSENKTDSIYRLLNTMVQDNPIERERIVPLKGLIDRKFVIISQQLESLRQSHLEMNDFIKEKAVESKQVMDSIRNIAGLMENRETQLLKERTESVAISSNIIFTIIIISFVTSILLVCYSLITYNFENRAKRRANVQAADYHEQLEKRVQELHEVNRELLELRNNEKFASTGRLARVIAHEVRNPLTNIDLSAGQLDAENLTPEDKRTFLEIIERNSKRINHLINDLLNATKFTELKYESTNINELLDETLDYAGDRAQLNKIRIEKKYSRDIPTVKVDKERMKIAFLNIIMNAIESMHSETGVLLLETSIKNNSCVINISDNGKGMDAETISKIFDPYFTSKSRGNGLGLTNTQNIILNHKGKIQVSSEVGKGSVFAITLNF